MKLSDFCRTFDIHTSVVELVERVGEETGKPVEFRIDKDMQAPATVKIARQRMSYHILKVHPSHADTMNYLVVNKCANILRMMVADPADRKVPLTNAATMEIAFDDIKRSLGTNQDDYPAHNLDYWIKGTIMQLSNLPVDIGIERWTAKQFPELKIEQQTYLQKDIQRTVAGLSDRVEQSTPRLIFETSNSMTYAYVRAVSELLNTNWVRAYYNHPQILQRGKELYGMVDDDDTGSFAGDKRIIDRWAEHLGIANWFSWAEFEDMPDEYFEDVR